jgi:hypothetical protein
MRVEVAAWLKKRFRSRRYLFPNYVCQSCGKDMGGNWEIICKECDSPFCYDCAYTDDEYWYCREHAPETAAKFVVCSQEDGMGENREELSTI